MANSAHRSPTFLFVWKARKTEPRCESKAVLVLCGLGEDADSIIAAGDAFQTSLSPRETSCTILSSPVGRTAEGQGGKSPRGVTHGHSSARWRCQGSWAFHPAALPQLADIRHLLGCVGAGDSHIPPLLTSPHHEGGISALCWVGRVSPPVVAQGPGAVPSRVTPEPSSRLMVLRVERGDRRSWPRGLLSR